MSRSLVRLGAALTAGLLALTAAAGPAATALEKVPAQETASSSAAAADHRVIAFYQTIYETGSDGVRRYVDPKPLLGSVTDVNVGAIHLNSDASLTFNDIPADHAELGVMWNDLATMQDQGVTVSAFLGGAAPGTYRYLREDFDRFYPVLRDFLRTYGLDGVDLDIEETFSLADTVHLIDALRADFGPDFVVTLTPVATDMAGRTSFSGGFSYAELERQAGDRIDWYNTQFYCGWGDLRTTTVYDQILANGFTPGRVVAGTVTNPGNCSGYVDPPTFDATVGTLVDRHPDFGGVFGWEYFNSVGHDGGGRETWFSHVSDVVNS
ncbi:glycosyl hydrolase family 18 protein [Promicromonospora sukumoe]